MTQLRACEACSRHVFANETVCPFCNAALSAMPERTFGERLRRGMSRAQLLAVAAAMTGQTLGACTDTPQNDGIPGGSGGTGVMDAGGESGEGGEGGGGAGGAGGMMSGGAGGAAGTVSGGTGGAAGTVSGGAGGAGGMAGGGAGGDQQQPVYGAPVDAGDDAAAADSGDMMAVPLYGGAPIPDPVP